MKLIDKWISDKDINGLRTDLLHPNYFVELYGKRGIESLIPAYHKTLHSEQINCQCYNVSQEMTDLPKQCSTVRVFFVV